MEGASEVYRSLGRYVYEFSRLVFWMRYITILRLTQEEPEVFHLGELALGEATAQPISNAFFAVCRESGSLVEPEEKIRSELQRQVNETIAKRNDIAHGDWSIGWGAGRQTILRRIKPARKTGALEWKAFHTAELDSLSNDLHTLRDRVVEFGFLATTDEHFPDDPYFGRLRVSDVLVLRGNSVNREGPRVDEIEFHSFD